MAKKQSPGELAASDPNVRRWHENMARSSRLNADVRLRRLNLFCQRTKTTPAKLVSAGRKDAIRVENILLDHVSWLESQDYAPNYIDGILKSVRAWLAFNYVEMRRKIRITNAGIPVRIQEERVPTKDELESILDTAVPKTRAVISLMAFAGLRPQVIGNADASDGLKLADLPDLVIENGKRQRVSFSHMPAMITVRATLSKTRNKYFTFLTIQGCSHVLGYLRQRISEGEPLGPESPLIAMSPGCQPRCGKLYSRKPAGSMLITTPRITSPVRKAIWSVMRARPYALRAYFDTQLLLAESHGKMTHAYRQFFMGHKGDIEARYTTNKGRLTDEMILDMRKAFSRGESFLSTVDNAQKQDKKDVLLDMWREQAKMYGIDPLKIKIEKQRNPTQDDAPTGMQYEIDMIRDAILESRGKDTSVPYDGKIVDNEEELLRHVCRGWEPVQDLGRNRYLIRKKKD